MMRALDRLQARLFWPIMVLIFGFYAVQYGMPASYWFTVDKVFVHDTLYGIPPQISYSRTIHHPFTGTWNVVVKEVGLSDREGQFYGVCEAQGPAIAKLTNTVKPHLDLDDWTFPVKCPLPVGTYILETVWAWQALGFERTVAVDSPAFHVYPTDTDIRVLK